MGLIKGHEKLYMNILFISQYFFPEQFSNNEIADNISKRGHEVSVYTAVPNYPSGNFFEGYSNRSKRSEQWREIFVHRVWTVPRGKSALSLLANYVTFPIAASIKVLFTKARPDVVFVSQLSPIFMVLPAILQKWKTGCGLVYWVQDIWPESATYTFGLRNRLVVGLLNAICGWLYRRADIVMVQSEAFHAMITRFGVPPERIRFLPNTAPDSYRPLTPEQAPDRAALVPQDGFRLMFAGNIGESQDFDTLIAAAALLRERKDLHWVIIGSGRDEERVRSLVAERGLEECFHFLGRHPEGMMPEFFAHADAMLVSLKDIPIFSLTVPYKVQCYLACGKPIVASLSGEGARIVNESGAGIAVAAAQPSALADAIVTMMDATLSQRQAYAASARRYFEEHYAAGKAYAILEKTLEQAARGGGDWKENAASEDAA